MGLFGKLFEKKECDFCGGEIGMLGNRKLEDGNMCKECAKKLSPWFDDRRHSTVEQIKQQLQMREANKQAVAAFHETRVYGEGGYKVYIDEANRKFMVCRKNERNENPDVFDFSQLTSINVDVDEDRDEDYYEDKEGNTKSYLPRRFKYYYNFYLELKLNHPYVDDIRIELNSLRISTTPFGAVPESQKPNPRATMQYSNMEQMGMEIKSILSGGAYQPQGFGGAPMGYAQPGYGAPQQPGFGGAVAGFGAGAGVCAAPQAPCAPQAPQQQAPQGGGWQCGCGNFVTGKFCPECGAKRPASAFQCDKCGWRPEPGTTPPRFCPQCGDPFDENDMM